MQVTMTVNGEEVTREIEGRLLLVHFLRDHLGLTGTHWGCDTSNCGTCVVWMDGEPVKSCTVLAAMAGGREVRTVEGLETEDGLDPVQQGFMQCHGLQCGFCTPGHAHDRPGPPRSRPGPERGHDPRSHLGPDLPVHRLHHHRPVDPLGRGARGRRPSGSVEVERWSRARHDHHRGAPPARVLRRQRPEAGRLRPDAAQGGPPLHPGPREVLRRRAAPGDAPPRHPPLAGRARPHRQHRHQRGRGPPPGEGGRHRRRRSPSRAWRGCPRCRTTCRPCWPPTRCASRARRSRSSSPRTATRPATASS